MTQLFEIFFGGSQANKLVLRVLIISSLCLGLFLSSAQLIFAQGDVGVGGIDRPYRPGEGPTDVTPITEGTDVGGGGASDDFRQSAEEAAVARENAAVAENMGALDDPILQFLHKYVLTGIGSFVGYTGEAFDYAIEEYIIGFGNLYINKNVGVAIDSLWGTVRDIFNLTFIFGLVYIGFKMILDSGDSNARKMLVSLIGAALLVNFSLFITKFVVDFSNIAATQIFNAFSTSANSDFSITNGFMTMMGVGTIFTTEMTASAGYAYIVGMLIVFAVLIYVFLAGAIMIIIRFVVLCIYMVFSPMMFLGWVFPSMKGHSEKYWSGFLKQAFFAPAFIFMLYLSYRVTSTFNYTTKNWGHFFGQGVAEPVGVDGLIPFFAMVIVFLLASIMVAKNMGAVGASTVVSVGNNMRGRAQVAMGAGTAGMAARLGRSTVGAGAHAMTQNKTFQKITSRTGVLGKNAMFAASNIADSSFDARKVGGVGNKLGIGEGKKGGFTTRLKETKESDHKFHEMLGKIEVEDDKDVKTQRATIEKLKMSLTGTRDDGVREQIEGQIVQEEVKLQAALTAAAHPGKVYANQLASINNKENWQAKQQKVLTNVAAIGAGIGATLLTGGIAGGAIAAASAYAVGRGNNMHSKADVKALRKEYGADGTAKKKAKEQEELVKKAMAALGYKEPETAAAHPAAAAKPTPHAPAKPSASKPTAVVAPASGGGGSHDHH